MKAIVAREFGGPEVLKLEDVPDPVAGQGQVRVRIHAVGVNPYDTYMRSGAYGARNPALPYTPGSDAAGIVHAAGASVTGWTVGERVYTTGTSSGAYAEFAVCKPSQLQRLPQRVTFSQGAAVYVPYATAYRALFQLAKAAPDETVLIHGASGGVGIAAVQLARAAGLTVMGTAGTDKGLETVKSEGAHFVFNHRAPDYQKEILEQTEGRGVDVLVEMFANINLANDLKLLAPRGRVAIVGSRGNVEINPRDLMSREAAIFGVFLWGVPESDLSAIFGAVNAGLENGTLRPIVGTELPLGSAAEAHRKVLEPGALGKIVLVP